MIEFQLYAMIKKNKLKSTNNFHIFGRICEILLNIHANVYFNVVKRFTKKKLKFLI